MQDDALFEVYKPLRNHISKTGLFDSLSIFWAYIQWLQFSVTLPSDIEILNEVRIARPQIFITEWNLEILIREAILNSDDSNYGLESLKKWNYFAGARNK